METNPNYRNDEDYIELMGAVNMLEDELREIQAMNEALDPEIVGQAAAIQNSMFQPDLVLSPANLKYLARQLRALLALRKHLPVNDETDPDGFWELPLEEMKEALFDSIEARNKLYKEKYGEEMIDVSFIPELGEIENYQSKPSDLQDVLSN